MSVVEAATTLAYKNLGRIINVEQAVNVFNQQASPEYITPEEWLLILYTTLFGAGLGLYAGGIAGVDLQKQPKPIIVAATTLGFAFLGAVGGVTYSLIN